MIIEGKMKLEQLKQSLDEVKPFYEYINEDGSVEKWELPQSVEETKKELGIGDKIDVEKATTIGIGGLITFLLLL